MMGIDSIALVVVLVGALVAIALIVRRRAPMAGIPPELVSLLGAARRRAVIAILFAGLVVVVLFLAGVVATTWLGLPAALAPALGGSAGLLLYSATPPRVVAVDDRSAREASLVPRTPLSFASPVGVAVLAALAIAQIAFLVFTGATASTDEAGRSRVIAFRYANTASASGPYPGWYYAIPLILVTVVLVAATLLALRRVSATPALPQSRFADVDEGWRRGHNRILLAVSSAALMLQFGGVAFFSGLAIRNGYIVGVAPVWEFFGVFCSWAGGLLIAGSMISLALSVLWALELPRVALAAGGSASAVPPRTQERVAP